MLRSFLCYLLVALALTAGPALADLKVYPVEPIKNLPEIDEGTGRLKFDFSKVKLTDKYDGFQCNVAVLGDVPNSYSQLAAAQFRVVDKGHIEFFNARWFTNGVATPEDLYRANLAITTKGQIVGTMLVFNIIDKKGDPPHPPQTVVIKASGGTLKPDKPEGDIDFEIPDDTPGRLHILLCKKP